MALDALASLALNGTDDDAPADRPAAMLDGYRELVAEVNRSIELVAEDEPSMRTLAEALALLVGAVARRLDATPEGRR